MAKLRSPRYPAISLPDAIEKVRAVYEKDFTNEVPKEVVVAHMGYTSINGASLGVVSAVLKYGLLEGPSSGMRVTPLALDILVNERGAPDRVAAIEAAAKKPELFNELFNQFPNGASDQALKAHLITRMKFLPSAVPGVIRAFRDTSGLVESEGGNFEADSPEVPAQVENSPSRSAMEIRQVMPVRTPNTSHYIAIQPEPTGAPSKPEMLFMGDSIRLGGVINNQTEAQRVIDFLTATKQFLANVSVTSRIDPPASANVPLQIDEDEEEDEILK